MKKIITFLALLIGFASYSQQPNAQILTTGNVNQIQRVLGGFNPMRYFCLPLDTIISGASRYTPPNAAIEGRMAYDPITKRIMFYSNGAWRMVFRFSDTITLSNRITALQTQVSNLPSPSVNSVFGRIGTVTAQTGDYNTSMVPEFGNQYHTSARVLALSPALSQFYDSLNAINVRMNGYVKMANLSATLAAYPTSASVAATYEPKIIAGTSTQYWRGDKTWQTLNKTSIGLGNVDNTADVDKPVSTAVQTLLTNTYVSQLSLTGTLNGYASLVYVNNTFATISQLNTKQNTITLTTTGTGAATFSGNVLNIPTPASAASIDSRAAYGSGTSYTLTTTSAKVTFGTTSPTVTLPSAGTYLITSNVKIEYVGLTTLVNNPCTFKIRRTNNTAADLTNALTVFNVPVVTLLTQTAGDADIPSVIYTTNTAGDVIELWGSRGANLSAGSIQIGSAEVIAIKLY